MIITNKSILNTETKDCLSNGKKKVNEYQQIIY